MKRKNIYIRIRLFLYSILKELENLNLIYLNILEFNYFFPLILYFSLETSRFLNTNLEGF